MLSVVRRNPQLHYIDSFLRCSQNKFLVLTKQTYTTTSRICEKTRLVPKVKLPRQPVPDLQHTLSKYLRYDTVFFSCLFDNRFVRSIS